MWLGPGFKWNLQIIFEESTTNNRTDKNGILLIG